MRLLNGMQVRQPLLIGDHPMIGYSCLCQLQAGKFIVLCEGGLRGIGLPGEQGNGRADGFELVVLVCIELELHARGLTSR